MAARNGKRRKTTITITNPATTTTTARKPIDNNRHQLQQKEEQKQQQHLPTIWVARTTFQNIALDTRKAEHISNLIWQCVFIIGGLDILGTAEFFFIIFGYPDR